MIELALVVTALAACGSSTASPGAKPVPSVPKTGVVQSNGARIPYYLYGDLKAGTPLLVLHGSLMSGEMMKPFIDRFVATRPIIALDQRGHGASGDFDGPLTYDDLAEDASKVLAELGVAQADVFGYSLGGVTGVALAARHPQQVRRLVVLSGASGQSGWHPEVPAAIQQLTPEMMGPEMIAAYDAKSPTPGKFPALIEKVKAQELAPFELPEAAIRAFPGKAMIIVGDHDAATLEHSVALFSQFGGHDSAAIATGMVQGSPKARLLVLPATGHLGVYAELDLIAAKSLAFLEDEPAPPFTGF